MSSEPPFEHPPDHSKYGPPPPEPPRSLPWYLTASTKTGCGVLVLFLLTQCCICGGIGNVHQEVKNRLDGVDRRLDEINKKLDNVTIKPKETPKEELKKDEPKKDDGNKKEK